MTGFRFIITAQNHRSSVLMDYILDFLDDGYSITITRQDCGYLIKSEQEISIDGYEDICQVY